MSRLDDEYEALAHSIALIIWASSVDPGDGAPCWRHLNENGLGAPADALTRLGVMKEVEPGAHAFTPSWRPGAPFRPVRHAGAPTIFDLILILMFLLDWFHSEAPARDNLTDTMPPMPDMTDDRRFMSTPHLRFKSYTLGYGAKALASFGLCFWDEDGAFQVVRTSDDYEPMDLLDIYDHSSFHIAKRLGGGTKLFP